MKLLWSGLICLLILAHFAPTRGDGDPKNESDKMTADALRKELLQMSKAAPDTKPRVKPSNSTLAEIGSLKDELLKAPSINLELSTTLAKMFKDAEAKTEPIVGSAVDIETDEIQGGGGGDNPKVSERNFQPNINEIKLLTNIKHSESNIHNLYRENLVIKSIREEFGFTIGVHVEEWKTLSLDNVAYELIGKSNEKVTLVIASEKEYEIVDEISMANATFKFACIEVLKLWDSNLNRVRNLVAVALGDEIIWYEVNERKFVQVYRWKLMKRIDKMTYFQHEGGDLLMITATDDQQRVEVIFIEFNFPNDEFSVVQSFKLPSLPSGIACLDAGKDLVVAFTQGSHIKIYRYQSTKFERGRFAFLKNIDTANVSVISGFRIGGYSYLAVGGDQPQILRYANGDFHPQTILSQTFGHVEEFLPIPIKVYRDDLVLLVQHRIKFRSHSVIVVDALIWNGIAFESALSIPCKVIARPDATGFTCMLDLEREQGLLGASFSLDERNNSFSIVMPRHEAHSGLFRINYEIVEAEDPLVKEMEQIKKAIEIINEMIDAENSVKQQIDDVFKSFVNPKADFAFENLEIDSIDTDVVHLDGRVLLESDRIDFLDASYSRQDFMANLDEIEKTLVEDERKLKQIDAELNTLIRRNRQAQMSGTQFTQTLPDSPVYYLGPYSINGQLDFQTLRVLPQDDQSSGRHRQRRQVQPIKQSVVSSLRVKDFVAETINGIPVSDYLFLQNTGELSVPEKDIVFEDSVHAGNVSMLNDGRVNGIDLSHEVLAVDSQNFPKSLTFESIAVENLAINRLNGISVDASSLQNISVDDSQLPTIASSKVKMQHDLTVETINGVDWDEFVSQLMPKSTSASAENLTVNGNVWLIGEESDINVGTLNSLKFPSEYVLKAGPQSTVIRGKKSFSGTLVTDAVDTSGIINGINPFDLITLDQEQTIPTETTFNVMEVNKKLEVHGTIAGQQLDAFLPNPTLVSANEILAACSFRDLVVEGAVKMEGSFNGQNLEVILADVIYEGGDEEVVVGAQKTFTELEVNGDVSLPSNYINNVKLDNIMTIEGEEIATIDKVFGTIFISNLKTDGLFDSINVTDLEMNSVRTFGDQYIRTPLVISQLVDANSVDIRETLNSISTADFYSIDEPITLPETMKVTFMHLNANSLSVKEGVVGTGTLTNMDLEEFSQRHLSKSSEQTVVAPVRIDNLVTRNVFSGGSINGVDFGIFKRDLEGLKNFKDVLLSGNYKLDSLIIDGDVMLQSINERDFNSIIENVIWLNRPNIIHREFKFLDGIDVAGKLVIEDEINHKSFNHFISNWISSAESPIQIRADKTVKNSVQVARNLDLGELNGIHFENILRVTDVLELDALSIYGSVKAINVSVTNNFNRESIKNLENVYSYDNTTKTHAINSDVKFAKSLEAEYLSTPFINEENSNELLENLIKTDDHKIRITSGLIFKGDIMVERGVYINQFNEINMESLMRDIVVLQDDKIVNINSNIVFMNDVYARTVGLRGNLTTDSISGCNIEEWISHAKPIDRDFIYEEILKADSRFVKAKNINIRKLNGIPFNNIFTIHTDQSFDYTIVVKDSVKVREPMRVLGKVNGKDLVAERNNTVMLDEKNQVIYTDLVLPGAIVLRSVTTSGLINSKDIQKIVILDSSPVLASSLTFSSLETIYLVSDDRISGINFTKWYESVVWKKGKDTQVIRGAWKLKKALLTEDVYGNGLINQRPINEIERNLKINVNAIEMAINNYSGQYSDMCEKLRHRAENFAQNSVYLLKYLESEFKITEAEEIFSHFAFEAAGEHYLLVNTKCTTQAYEWSEKDEKFIQRSSTETGVVYEWEKLEPPSHKGSVFIITNSQMKAGGPCSHGGLNSWKFIENKLMHISSISSDDDVLELHVDPANLKSFYVLTNSDHVINFDVFGNQLEKWKLPTENFSYSFLPSGILFGLNLNNGRRIFSLDSKFLRRGRRFLFDVNTPVMNMTKHHTKPGESPMFTFKMPDVSLTERKHSIPTIPSKSVKPSLTKKRVDYMSKVKKAGEVIKTSFNIQSESINNLKATIDESKYETKLAKLNETNKLLFVINSPNIASLKQGRFSNSTKKEHTPLNIDLVDALSKLGKEKEPVESTTTATKEEASTTSTTQRNLLSSLFVPTPRIIMPPEDDDVSAKQNVPHKEEPRTDSDLESERQLDVVAVQGSGIRDMENAFIPEKEFGEVTVLYVGVNGHKRPLFAVKKKRDSVIRGNDFIEIYSDIIEGRVFQYIQCTNPSDIVALQFRDETLLAFMESQNEVQIFIYRGIEGFTFFRKISLATEAARMSSLVLPPKIDYKCDHHYLVLQTDHELLFLGVKVDGNCGMHAVQCKL